MPFRRQDGCTRSLEWPTPMRCKPTPIGQPCRTSNIPGALSCPSLKRSYRLARDAHCVLDLKKGEGSTSQLLACRKRSSPDHQTRSVLLGRSVLRSHLISMAATNLAARFAGLRAPPRVTRGSRSIRRTVVTVRAAARGEFASFFPDEVTALEEPAAVEMAKKARQTAGKTCSIHSLRTDLFED